MSQSTCALGNPPAKRRRTSETKEARQRRVRRELTFRLQDRALSAVSRLVNQDSPPHAGGAGIAAAQITYQTAMVLGDVLANGRPLRDSDRATFRILGDLAGKGRLLEDDTISAMEVTCDAVLGMMRREARYGDWSERTGLSAVKELEQDVQAFMDTASKELRLGMAGEIQFGLDRGAVVARVLDGHLAGDEMTAAVGTVAIDPSREYGVVLLVAVDGRSAPLAEATAEVVGRVPNAIDAGEIAGPRAFRRVVLPVITHGRWIEARSTIHDITTKHHVLAVAPAAARSLAALVETYTTVAGELGETIASCRFTSGVIDPAMPRTPDPAPQALPVERSVTLDELFAAATAGAAA